MVFSIGMGEALVGGASMVRTLDPKVVILANY